MEREGMQRGMCSGDMASHEASYTAVQNQKAVSAYFTSKQRLPLDFAGHYTPRQEQ